MYVYINSVEGAKNVSWPWLLDSLTMAFQGKFGYIGYIYIYIYIYLSNICTHRNINAII